MELRIVIDDRKLMLITSVIIAVSLVGLTMAYGGTSPATMGHTWGETECAGCIATGNLADNSVNGNKVLNSSLTGGDILDGSLTGADIQDGSIATADIASIDGGKITGTVPAATAASTLGGYTGAQLKDFIGMTLPASTICNGVTLTLVSTGAPVIYSNTIAVKYDGAIVPSFCPDCGTYQAWTRYYFGNGEWSGCIEGTGSCYCNPGSGN